MRKFLKIVGLFIGIGCFSVSYGASVTPDGGSGPNTDGAVIPKVEVISLNSLPLACVQKIDALIQEINQKYELKKYSLPLFSESKDKQKIVLPYSAEIGDQFPQADADLDVGGLDITGGNYASDNMGRCSRKKEISLQSSLIAAEVDVAMDEERLKITVKGCLLDSIDLANGKNLKDYYEKYKLGKVNGGGFFFAYPLTYYFDFNKTDCSLEKIDAEITSRIAPFTYIKHEDSFVSKSCQFQVPPDTYCVEFKIPEDKCRNLRFKYLKGESLKDRECPDFFDEVMSEETLKMFDPDTRVELRKISESAMPKCKNLQILMNVIDCEGIKNRCDIQRRNDLAARYQICQKFTGSSEKLPIGTITPVPSGTPVMITPSVPTGQPINH